MEEQGMGMREYRKGNWTVQETMILIEAKKMDDERRKLNKKQTYQNIIASPMSPRQRLNPGSATASPGPSPSPSPSPSPTTSSSVIVKPVTELRWKWVEEYCWRKGCLRSQNQCNDKWDNLMRDYKKIRDYQRNFTTIPASPRLSQESGKIINKSYWEMDKVERKDKSLPTNMLPQIYEALFDVVEHIGSTITSTSTIVTTTTTTAPAITNVVASVGGGGAQFLPLPPPLPISTIMPPPELPVLRLQTQSPFYSQQVQQPVEHHLLPTLESEASEDLRAESSAKKRRKEERVAPTVEGTSSDAPETGHHQMATTTHQMATTSTPTPPPGPGPGPGPGPSPTTSLQEVSSEICRSASVISEAIQSNEEKQERRHKEIMHLHQTRLRIEESKLEVTRQGFIGLSDAINNLANSILTWANTSHNSHHQGP